MKFLIGFFIFVFCSPLSFGSEASSAGGVSYPFFFDLCRAHLKKLDGVYSVHHRAKKTEVYKVEQNLPPPGGIQSIWFILKTSKNPDIISLVNQMFSFIIESVEIMNQWNYPFGIIDRSKILFNRLKKEVSARELDYMKAYVFNTLLKEAKSKGRSHWQKSIEGHLKQARAR
ncbi:MAG: hypothetical protein ACO3LE_10495 [Bdellovibrionota bacterium]